MRTYRRRPKLDDFKTPLAVLVVVLLAVTSAVFVFFKPAEGHIRRSRGGRDVTFIVTRLDGQKESSGKFVVRTKPEWSPNGVKQFHKLVDAGFYNQCRFFRVVPNFIVQFGMNGDPKVQEQWNIPIMDDPVVTTNARGTVAFAISGPNTRTTQLFINTNTDGNAFLDKQGFSPFGQVISGMDVVDHIFADHGETPKQAVIRTTGNEYLKFYYPKLSYIVTAASE